MRWIMACGHGHLSDVPWEKWVHQVGRGRNPGCSDATSLYFETKGDSGGLDSVFVSCRKCGASAALEPIQSEKYIASLKWKCRGLQPWQQGSHAAICEIIPRVVQKGAGNVCFPRCPSTLDIPPHALYSPDESTTIKNAKAWSVLIALCDNLGVDGPATLQYLSIVAKQSGTDVAAVKDVLSRHLGDSAAAAGTTISVRIEELEVLRLEYKALLTPRLTQDPRDHFLISHVTEEMKSFVDSQSGLMSEIGSAILPLFDSVAILNRLRIVTSIEGFHRLYSPGGLYDQSAEQKLFKTHSGESQGPRMVAADMAHPGIDWLPAVENFGEGIFIAPCENVLAEWSARPEVKRRYDAMKTSPILFVLHTLSHLLIRQLGFECGYGMADVSERIYFDDHPGRKMAGILIYTAAGDSQGSLGGLARLGRPERFLPLLYNAVREARLCANDPLCMECDHASEQDRNLAACHSCLLVPEISCRLKNGTLDRASIVGDDQHGMPGLMQSLSELEDMADV